MNEKPPSPKTCSICWHQIAEGEYVHRWQGDVICSACHAKLKADRSPAQVTPETCFLCGRQIGATEQAHMHKGEVACSACIARLEPTLDPVTRPGRGTREPSVRPLDEEAAAFGRTGGILGGLLGIGGVLAGIPAIVVLVQGIRLEAQSDVPAWPAFVQCAGILLLGGIIYFTGRLIAAWSAFHASRGRR